VAISVIAFSEKRQGDRWVLVEREVMDWHARTYSAFLAGVRNSSLVPPIAEPRGAPVDMSEPVAEEFVEQGSDAVAPSWLSMQELLQFDYETRFEDRRVARRMPAGYLDHAAIGEPGEGRIVTYREFLGPAYFEELEKLSESGAERVVFWFSI
jgi:hypothetical protein